MRFADVVNQKKSPLVVRTDPPKGGDPTPLLETALAVRGRIDATCFSDCPMAIMRMNPLAPCHLLQQKKMETILNINARDRNRLSVQSELLAAWALGVRSVLLCEGEDPSYGDHPVTQPSKDIDLEGMLEVISAFAEGKDLAGQPLGGEIPFYAGIDMNLTDDPETNRRNASSLGRFAELGARFVFLGPSYDLEIVTTFVEAAAGTGIKVFGSVLLLKSLGMAKYLNSIKGIPDIPGPIMERILKAPMKQKACLEIAADTIREVREICDGAVIVPLGWEAKLPELLDLLQE